MMSDVQHRTDLMQSIRNISKCIITNLSVKLIHNFFFHKANEKCKKKFKTEGKLRAFESNVHT